MAKFLARQQHLAVVGSTNDVVRGWLAEGTPEVCLAVADEQSAGRGRDGRTWTAPAGAALLLSIGFRPTWLPPERLWRLAASVSLAMAEAGESIAELPARSIRLKWPNDLVVESSGATPSIRKLAGVLGETDGLGTDDPRAVIGIGVNTEWPATAFTPDLADAMTSLREVSPGRGVDNAPLLDTFLGRLEARIDALRGGRFDVADWTDRQITTDRAVDLIGPEGAARTVRALGVDAETGALVVEDPAADTGRRPVVVGEIRHVRLTSPVASVGTGV